jgi:histidinol-phosphate aminotransferase
MTVLVPTPRPGILSISPYVGGEASLPGIKQPIKLSANEAAFGPSPKAIAAYQALAGDIHRYPDGHAQRLRKALAEHWGLEAERIVCGNGSDDLLQLLARAYSGPGDEVLYSRHGFAIYPIAAQSCGATPVAAPEIALTASVDQLLAAVTPRTRMVFLANPNNPTGTYLPGDEVRRLHAGLAPDILLVLDAAYAEYMVNNDYEDGAALVRQFSNVVMTRTFSKIYALGGLRLGWAYCPPAIADVLNRIRGPFNVASCTLEAGIAALSDIAFTDRVRHHNEQWRAWFADELVKLGLSVPPHNVGNFLLVGFPDTDGKSAQAADAFLRRRGIIVRGLGSYGLPDHLRITIGLEEEMRAVVAALTEFVGG